MSTIVPPAISAAVSLGPVSQILPAQYRFAGDDWDDDGAFVFTFYTVLPTFDPVTGSVISPGQVRDLTGCSFSGTVSYRPRPRYTYQLADASFRNPYGPPGQFVPSSVPPASQAMVGSVDVPDGQATLTLSADRTIYPRQDYADVWTPGVHGFELASLLEVRGRLTDPHSKTTTQGVIPLFVF